jgi:hypothetical protein
MAIGDATAGAIFASMAMNHALVGWLNTAAHPCAVENANRSAIRQGQKTVVQKLSCVNSWLSLIPRFSMN